MENLHELGMKAALEAAKNSGLSFEHRVEAAVQAYLDAKDDKNETPPLLTRLYKFFNDSWVGSGSEMAEGSFGRELHDWREEIFQFHKSAKWR